MFGCNYSLEKNMLNNVLHRKIKILESQKTQFFLDSTYFKNRMLTISNRTNQRPLEQNLCIDQCIQ